MFHIIKPGSRFDIIGKQKSLMFISLLLVLASIGVIVGIGPKYGIDFKGGSDIILGFKGSVTAEQVRDAARGAVGFKDASVQRFGSEDKNQFLVQTSEVSVVNQELIKTIKVNLGGDAQVKRDSWSQEEPDRYEFTLGAQKPLEQLIAAAQKAGIDGATAEPAGIVTENKYVLRFPGLQSRINKGFYQAMPKLYPSPEERAADDASTTNKTTGVIRLETVGSRVGDQLRTDGLTAFLLSLVAILLYIALRFDIRYAPGAVVAIFHDVLIAFGILTIVGIEINLPILAAALTIVGYSLNDTIVVFDRIRENYAAGHGGNNLAAVVNTSINETLSRTLITSLTTFLAVAVIAALGSGLIVNFSITLIIGVVVGTYSSIFVASPILLVMDRWVSSRQQARALRRPATTTEPAEPSV